MTRFVLRRLLWAVVTALVASAVAFALFWAIPNGSPAWKLGGGLQGTEATRAAAEARYGLDDPLPEQYVRLMKQIVTGEIECYYSCGDLRADFFDRLPVTAAVVGGAAILSIALGTLLALLCVRFRGRRLDRAILRLAVVLYSVPSLVLAAVLWTVLARDAQWFPASGYVGLTEDPIRWAWHLALPWVAAALPFAGIYAQLIRSAMLETVDAGHVQVARAKGLPERRVLTAHVLRNAIASPVNVVGLDLSHAFGGFALYVEAIFGVPGVGELTQQTLDAHDLPPLVALAMWLALVVVVVGALTDIVVAALDPRARRLTA